MPAVYERLNSARVQFHSIKLKKTGKNTFANYSYFELGDFLIPALQCFHDHGLCAIVSFTSDIAEMRIIALEDQSEIIITSPMGSAALKGCHEVQNIGAVETYQRRYLWVAAMEIVEHDALDATSGKDEPDAKQKPANNTKEQIIDQAQFKELQDLMDRSGTAAETICTGYKIDAVAHLPAKSFAALKTRLTGIADQLEKAAA